MFTLFSIFLIVIFNLNLADTNMSTFLNILLLQAQLYSFCVLKFNQLVLESTKNLHTQLLLSYILFVIIKNSTVIIIKKFCYTWYLK